YKDLIHVFYSSFVFIYSVSLHPLGIVKSAQNLGTAGLKTHSRRNAQVLAVPQFSRLPNFWGWYKYFVDTHNQEGVSGVCEYELFTPESESAPAPAKVPASILTPVLPRPLKSPTGFYSYTPVLEPFLSTEQRTELLQICNPEDVECLQYHLRADPYCMLVLIQQTPTSLYHLLYPNCDPAADPLCLTNIAARAPLAAEEAPKEQHCNPLFDPGCNQLTATKMSGLTNVTLLVELSTSICADIKAPTRPFCHPFDPICGKFALPPSTEVLKPCEDGIILPDPDCNPDYNYNCCLRCAELISAREKAAKEAAVP
uniref:Uncharacterized protein n=1 Tax=Monopterus albus TaxID=43700 RepID=A0A3Q3K1T5_MONAL